MLVHSEIRELYQHGVLWISYPSTMSSTLSSLLTSHPTSLSRSSFSPPIISGTFPVLYPMLHSLKWNAISIFNPPLVDWTNGFHSYLVCFPLLSYNYYATALQHCSSALISSHLLFLFFIEQPFSLVTISLSGDLVSPYFTWSMHCSCIVYNSYPYLENSPASSMQFSLVSSIRVHSETSFVWPLPNMNRLA